MNEYRFGEVMFRLESYLGVKIEASVLKEYYRRFGNFDEKTLDAAITTLIDEHEIKSFPLVPEFWTAIEKMESAKSEERPDEGNVYCEACDNIGMVLIEDGLIARPCRCRRGVEKAAAWKVPTSWKQQKRKAEIEKLAKRLPPAELPVRGLHEWNPLGFWEGTQATHDRWMAEKRAQIEALDARRAGRPEPAPKFGETEWRGTLMKTVAGLVRPREPGEDEEEEEVPF
jgi:hypothetical protein